MTTRRLRFIAGLVVGLTVCVAGPGAAAEPTPAEKCEARKLKAAGKKAECLGKEAAREVLGGTSALPSAATNSGRLREGRGKAAPGICPTGGTPPLSRPRWLASPTSRTRCQGHPSPRPVPGDGQTTCWNSRTAIARAGTGHDGDQAGATLSYTDNGDGRSPTTTGLMWKLCDEDPPGTCPAGTM
jgi:hypothetical protein